jgi:hypothetical protein
MYGLPSPETFEALERGEIPGIAIGGCVLDDTNPTWAVRPASTGGSPNIAGNHA